MTTRNTNDPPAIEELMAKAKQVQFCRGLDGKYDCLASGDRSGSYVLASDYDLLAAEMERLQERLEAAQASSKRHYNTIQKIGFAAAGVCDEYKEGEEWIAELVTVRNLAQSHRNLEQEIASLRDRAAAAEANRDEWHEQHENLLAIYRTAEERILKLRQERDTYKRGYEGREKAKKMWADKARERARERDQLRGDLNAIAKRVQDIEQSKTKATERELWESIAYHKQMAYRNAQRAERLQTEIYQLEGDKLSMQELIKMGDENTLKYLEQKQERDAAEFASLQSSLQSSESARQAAEAKARELAKAIFDEIAIATVAPNDGWRQPSCHEVSAVVSVLVRQGFVEREPSGFNWYRLLPQESEVKG